MIKCELEHTNFNVADLQASIDFYEKALGMRVIKRKDASDGSFTLVYLQGEGGAILELTWLRDKEGRYNLGDNETHIAVRTQDYEAAHALHAQMGCICYENEKMGLYFISDPDGYWIEILPYR